MFTEYQALGWKLCAVPAGTKGPTYFNWNTKPIEMFGDEYPGAGLLHALSGTCALDIDNYDKAKAWLADRLINIDTLLNDDRAVRIDSGRPGRAKLLYRLKSPLATLQPADSGLELRCATSKGTSVQDVLPPSIHPDTKKPYRWMTGILGDWRELPPIPAALYALWREMAEPIATEKPVERTTVKPKVDLARLRKGAFKHDPNCEYPEWFEVGARLHDGTGGDGAGLDIWIEWSKGITRAPYPGDAFLKQKWLTMSSEPGKQVASGEALAAESMPETDDYEVISEVITNTSPTPRADALANLIKRFVFVIWDQEYFDTERNALIGDKAIRHMFTSAMPKKNGSTVEQDPVDILMRAKRKDWVEAVAFYPG